MHGIPLITAVTISAALGFGLVLSLLAGLKRPLSGRLDLPEDRVGGLLSALNLALLPLLALSGFLTDLWGPHLTLILGSVAATVGFGLLSLPSSPRPILAALLAALLGCAALGAGALVLIPHAFFAPHDETTASFNMGLVFCALGALVAPELTDLLLRALGLRRAAAVMTLVCLVPAALALLAGRGELDVVPGPARLTELVTFTPLWAAVLVFLCYAPVEASVLLWLQTNPAARGPGETRAVRLTSGFWAAFLGGRLLTAYCLHGSSLVSSGTTWIHFLPPLFLVLPALLTAALLGNLIGSASPGRVRYGMLLLAFVLGPILPTLLGILTQLLERDQVNAFGTAYGLVFALGSLGGVLLAPTLATRAVQPGRLAAFRLPLVLALSLTALALVFLLADRV